MNNESFTVNDLNLLTYQISLRKLTFLNLFPNFLVSENLSHTWNNKHIHQIIRFNAFKLTDFFIILIQPLK